MATQTSNIQAIGLVMAPTADQDRAIAFYESLGFEKRTDIPFGGQYRWVEVYPPGGTTGIALAPPRPARRQAEGDRHQPHAPTTSTPPTPSCGRWRRRRRRVSRMGDPVPPMFWFRDPDGHSLMVVESHEPITP